MAGQEGFADVDGGCALSSCKEGPVLTMINKRLRALKKKYNRILQIEESKAQGKQINKEQEEVLKAKLAVGVLIEEYEKLRPPLMAAVKEEIEKEVMEIVAKNEEVKNEEKGTAGDEDVHVAEVMDTRVENEERSTADDEDVVNVRGIIDGEAEYDASLHAEKSNNAELVDDGLHGMESLQSGPVPFEREVSDLLHLLYFAQLFDVPRADATPSLLWTKVHERSSCVSYDCVTEEDSSSPLEESDLNDLSLLGSLIISRTPDATLSHQGALQHCARHALLWLGNSDAPIKEGLVVTYSHLRERLSRILSSEYYTMIPELQTFGRQAVAAAASATGQYSPPLLIQAALSGSGPSLYYANQDRAPELLLQSREQYTAALPMRNIISEMSADPRLVMNAAAAYVPEPNVLNDANQVDVEAAVTGSTSNQEEEQQNAQFSLSIDPLHSTGVQELQEQQPEFEITGLSADSREYQGPNGGVAPGNNHGRARSYTSGRAGVGRGGYGNGRGVQFHDQRGHFPRSQYGRGNGRGMRASGSSTFNGYANGQSNNRGSGGAPV